MEVLNRMAAFMASAWSWLVGLEGWVQTAVALVAAVAALALFYFARGMQRPSYDDQGRVGRTVAATVAYIGGVLAGIVAVVTLVAVFYALVI